MTGVVLSAMLALGLATPASSAGVGALAAPAERQAGARAAEDPRVRPARDPLERPARGDRAIEALGDRLPEVARLNGLSRATLGSLLAEDSSAWVATDGRVFFREPRPTRAEIEATPDPEAAPSLPLSETFALHSRPGAARTVFLDVDGATVSGTAWNDSDGVGSSHPAWDPSGDGTAFDDAELARVQAVWEMVAADFAAFDVDVTTEDPGGAGLTRTSSSDTTYGAHVVITPSPDAWEGICDRVCGGVAYISVFDEIGPESYYQPAWVFTDGLRNSTKSIAEAASHEVGHQLGLRHDGKGSDPYYSGHGSWGPIMGSAYGRPVSQWSNGAYAGATTTQNDVSIIADMIPRVPDEAGEGVGGSAPLPEGAAYVASRTDEDTYSLGECTGDVEAAATTSGLGPDLDLQLTLLDAEGDVVETADPASTALDPSRASGMDATLTSTVAPGTYHLSVDGVGNGTPDTGYDDYASIGDYELDVSGCSGESPAGAPSAPRDLAATPDGAEPEVTLTWSAPLAEGDSGITGFTVTRSGSATPVALAAGARSHTFMGLDAGTDYTFTLRAQNASGAGPSATTTATTAAPPVRAPGAPRSFAGWWDADARLLRLSWLPPEDDGGAAVSAYRFTIDGNDAGGVSGSARSASGSDFDPGTYTVAVRAVNAAGAGTASTVRVTVPPLATRSWTGRSVSEQTVRLRTIVRLPDGDLDGEGPPTGSVVFRDAGHGRVGTATLEPLDEDRAIARLVLHGVAPGWHTYRGVHVPDDTVRLDSSSHRAKAVQVARLASRTSMRAPYRASPGARPVVRVAVAGGDAAARGRVRFVVRAVAGRTAFRAARPRLRGGTLRFRLPSLRPGRVRVVARYGGSSLHQPSKAGRTIRVGR